MTDTTTRTGLFDRVTFSDYGTPVTGVVVWQGNAEATATNMKDYSLIATGGDNGWTVSRDNYISQNWDCVTPADEVAALAYARVNGLERFIFQRTESLSPTSAPEPVHTESTVTNTEDGNVLVERFSRIIAGIGDALKAEAESRDYCNEFEQAVDKMADDLPHPYADVMREHAMREGMLERDYTISWSISYSTTVTASDAEGAREAFRESEREYVRSALYEAEIEIDDVEED